MSLKVLNIVPLAAFNGPSENEVVNMETFQFQWYQKAI